MRNHYAFKIRVALKYNIIANDKIYKKNLYKWECDELWKDYCICNPIERKISYEDIKNIIYDTYDM